MSTITEQLASLVVGSVESVSPSEIKVVLNPEAPQSTAINTGVPTGFPKLNSYILIPNEGGAVVGLVAWLGVERSSLTKRDAHKESGLVDLPFPIRRMTLTPVGTLVVQRAQKSGTYEFRLRRGVSVFPSVGDQVLLPTAEQLRSIIESQGADRRVAIGVSPLTGSAVVSVDPDKLFGRHLAVLGNTGSGKSCSVAGLLRWSLEAAAEERSMRKKPGPVNARFVILDPNGEYLDTFSDMKGTVRVFQVPHAGHAHLPLTLPAWMWNSQEWSAFAGAAPQTQRPLLLQALRDLRAGKAVSEPIESRTRRLMNSYKASFEAMIAQGVSAYSGFPGKLECGHRLQRLEEDANAYAAKSTGKPKLALEYLASVAKQVASSRYYKTATSEGFNNFGETDLAKVVDALTKVIESIPPLEGPGGPTEDSPIPFDVKNLPDHLEFLASSNATAQIVQFIATLTMRIRMMLADRRLGPLVVPKEQPTFEEWLGSYMGVDSAKTGQIAILDLSLVPSDVLHIAIAIVARTVFECTQRYKKMHNQELPTILVLEEAHTFIQSSASDDIGSSTAAHMCRQTFERIAREGRKFGLGMVLSSQRPSELSPTVLAQCNTFLLHRIVNDRDQELVKKLVPDTLGGLFRELPSLPARQAIILGWATPIPVLVEINELAPEHRPRSHDPKFWSVWTGEEDRPIDWKKIAADWIS